MRGGIASVVHIQRRYGEVPRGETMLYSGTDPESYITDYTTYNKIKFPAFRAKYCLDGRLLGYAGSGVPVFLPVFRGKKKSGFRFCLFPSAVAMFSFLLPKS